jgi:hypothetical protein
LIDTGVAHHDCGAHVERASAIRRVDAHQDHGRGCRLPARQ